MKMYYFAAINKYLDALAAHWEETREARTRCAENPGSDDAKKYCEDAMKMMDDKDHESLSFFKLDYNDGVADLRRHNRVRMVEPPEDVDVNVLTVLQMIYHPDEALLRAVSRTVGHNKMAMQAVRSIAERSWSDEPWHMPDLGDDAGGPMTEDEAEKHIAKIEHYCQTLEDLDVARAAKRYMNENDFLVSVAEVEDLAGFHAAISRSEKY